MPWFRLTRCLIASAAFVLPLIASWGLIVATANNTAPPSSSSRIPSPTKTTATMCPVEALVYADPWFAGTIWLWVFLWGCAGVTLTLLALFLPVRNRWSLLAWGICSVVAGSLFAGPWIYGLCCVLKRT